MHQFEVTICTPNGNYTMVIPAASQHGAVQQARYIAESQGGRVGNGGHARQVG